MKSPIPYVMQVVHMVGPQGEKNTRGEEGRETCRKKTVKGRSDKRASAGDKGSWEKSGRRDPTDRG